MPDYRLIDCDEHYYETEDCFARHMPREHLDDAVQVIRKDGAAMMALRGRPLLFSTFPDAQTPPPGALAGLAQTDDTDAGSDDTGRPAWAAASLPRIGADNMAPYTTRDARLALMDEQGIERALLFPTAVLGIEHDLARDPSTLHKNVTAFNRWLEEQWGFAGRIIAPAWLALHDPAEAAAEADRLIQAGVRAVMLRAGPVAGRSPADPAFDPVWARLAEARVLVTIHGGNSGYQDMLGPLWGEPTGLPGFRFSPFAMAVCFVDRAIADTLSALILHNLFARHPRLRVASVENGSSWAMELLPRLDRSWRLARRNPGLGGAVEQKPSDVFRRHIWVNPYSSEDIPALAELIGVDRVLFGSDFPHPTAAADPRAYLRGLSGFDAAETRAIMRDNADALLGE